LEQYNEKNDLLKAIEMEADSDMHPLLKAILDNIKPIGMVLGGIVVAVGIYSGITSYQESQHAKAVSALGSIMITNDPAARTQKLEDFVKTGAVDLRIAAQLELAKTYMDAKEYDKAAAAWQAVSVGASMKTVAGLGEAKALMFKGDYAKATDILLGLKKDAGDDYAQLISSTLAFAAEKAGKNDIALGEYETLKTKSGSNTTYLDHKILTLKGKTQS